MVSFCRPQYSHLKLLWQSGDKIISLPPERDSGPDGMDDIPRQGLAHFLKPAPDRVRHVWHLLNLMMHLMKASCLILVFIITSPPDGGMPCPTRASPFRRAQSGVVCLSLRQTTAPLSGGQWRGGCCRHPLPPRRPFCPGWIFRARPTPPWGSVPARARDPTPNSDPGWTHGQNCLGACSWYAEGAKSPEKAIIDPILGSQTLEQPPLLLREVPPHPLPPIQPGSVCQCDCAGSDGTPHEVPPPFAAGWFLAC